MHRKNQNRLPSAEQTRREFWRRKEREALDAAKLDTMGILFDRSKDFS